MVARKVRDIYGNWIWEDSDDASESESSPNPDRNSIGENYPAKGDNIDRPVEKSEKEKSLKLDWRDYVALTLASLQTILMPIIVMIALLVVLVLILVH